MLLATRGILPAKWRALRGKWRVFPGKVWKVAATWKSFQGVGNIVSREKEDRFGLVETVSRRAASVSSWRGERFQACGERWKGGGQRFRVSWRAVPGRGRAVRIARNTFPVGR